MALSNITMDPERRVIILNPDLAAPSGYRYREQLDSVCRQTTDPKSNGSEKLIGHTLPDNADEYHPNYLKYLTSAWAQHKPICINPDIVWFAALNEIAKGVVANADAHRTLFTKSVDKIDIAVPVGSASEIIPLDMVVENLRNLVPVDIDLFIPTFTTTTAMSQLTHYAAFAETCSPYYSYSTYLCNFPKVRIDGSDQDYAKMLLCAVDIGDELDRIGSPLMPWFAKTLIPWLSGISTAVVESDAEFFKKFLATERCGSGGEITVDGWWTKVFKEQPTLPKPENFPSQIARVPWTNTDTGRKFTVNCGILYSTLSDDGFSEPQFGCVQNELT